MVLRFLFLFIITFLSVSGFTQKTDKKAFKPGLSIPFDTNKNQTATYEEIVNFYRNLDLVSDLVQVREVGITDGGHMLQEVVISKQGFFTPALAKNNGKAILFINNGIHPGEPDGIDASMIFARDMIHNPEMIALLDKVTIVILPVYNIGGCINRSSTSRANQNGPEAYGFRANEKNLDLNRDFIKCDTKNAASFNQLFNYWDPDIMIDTHTSNGADYQYTMTLIATQKDKLHPLLSVFMTDKLLPVLYEDMLKEGWEMIPYVNSNGVPETGIYGFMETPRYSSGYAALHHTISFMPETHMLKPYEDRVISTYAFLSVTADYVANNGKELMNIRKQVKESVKSQKVFPLNYVLNSQKPDSILFKGFTASYKKSEVSGLQRLYYDKSKPWQKMIPFYNHYKANIEVEKPLMYIVPQAYDKIINLMLSNGVKMERLDKDTILNVEIYRIEKYETSKTPYEGHYNHYQTEVSVHKKTKQFFKGDYLIPTDQEKNRYIIETLEPQAPDSWFNWNFFDGILAQKEYFSDYVFEDLADELLTKNPEWSVRLEERKISDSKFANDARAQLDFVYKNSAYYEATHMMYPVARIVKF